MATNRNSFFLITQIKLVDTTVISMPVHGTLYFHCVLKLNLSLVRSPTPSFRPYCKAGRGTGNEAR